MKGLLLSVLSSFILFGLSPLLLRFYRGKKYYRVFLLAFLGALVFYIGSYRTLPRNLGFLPESFIESYQRMDFWNGGLVLLFIFHLFWNVAYAVAFTGFSSHLVVLLDESRRLSTAEILKIYGDTGSEDQVIEWRLNNLLRRKYLVEEANGFRLTAQGKAVALIARFLRWLYVVEERG